MKVINRHKVWHLGREIPPMNLMLLPYGEKVNNRLREAKKGDVIEFADGSEVFLKGVALIKLDAKATDVLSHLRYGKGILAKYYQWQQEACYLGHTRAAISNKFCLLVTYQTNEDDNTDEVQ